MKLRISATSDPFLDDRLRVATLPEDHRRSRFAMRYPARRSRPALRCSGNRVRSPERDARFPKSSSGRITSPTDDFYPRRRPFGVDQRGARQFYGTYSPVNNPLGTRLKSAHSGGRQCFHGDRAGESKRIRRSRKFAGVWALSGTLWSVHSADVHSGARLEQQKPGQQIPCRRAAYPPAHSGPETAADARTHFGIFRGRRCGSCSRAVR